MSSREARRPEEANVADPSEPRDVCHRCHKARVVCVCASIERVDNRTPVVILQHPRERGHPLGTARFARLGLVRCEIHVTSGRRGAELPEPDELPEGCALLFPGGGVPSLDQLPEFERPRSLLVLDGTWSTAGKLRRANPWLDRLPRVGLSPVEPGNYRIRKEPRPECLSTIESVVMALRVLEPHTAGLEGLLDAFTAMVDRQVEYAARGAARPRRRERRRVALAAIPAVIRDAPQRLIAVYTESTQQVADGRSRDRQLVYCSAVRVADGRRFEAYLRPEVELSPKLVGFMGLEPSRIADGETTESFARRWRGFASPDDVLVAWNKTNLDLLREACGVEHATVVLKGVYGNLTADRQGSAEATAARHGLEIDAPLFPGRPGRRMAAAMALLKACQGDLHTGSAEDA